MSFDVFRCVIMMSFNDVFWSFYMPFDDLRCLLMFYDAFPCFLMPFDGFRCLMMTCDALWCFTMPFDAFRFLLMAFDALWCLSMAFRWLVLAFQWLLVAFRWLSMAFGGFRRLAMSFKSMFFKSMSFKTMSFEEMYRILIFAFFFFKNDLLCRERRGKMTARAIKKEADFEDDFTRPVLVLRSFPPLGK